MPIEQLFEFVILPVLGWLLWNSNKNGSRLTRIETSLEILLKKFPKNDSEN
jgi:hypothetical protein